MAAYKTGDKFIIEIDSVMTNKNGTLYGIKGFTSLVFDECDLGRFARLDPDSLESAFESGVNAGYRKGMRSSLIAMEEYVRKQALKD